ncbi:MAG: TetR/AcrR family transcriptional regulator [Eubacterium sp.]|nr:TetR/AcrR family transcriptional regulator [Eubacterium sp.]
MTEKSVDKRAVRSRNMIKTTFIELMQVEEYENITVTNVCSDAQISRSTFYQHYRGVAEVLDEVLYDVFQRVRGLKHLIEPKKSMDSIGQYECHMPICDFVRENPKYQYIITNPKLLNQVLVQYLKVMLPEKSSKIPIEWGYSREQLEAIYVFQMTGCLNAIRQNLNKSDREWDQIKRAIDKILMNGVSESAKVNE